MAIDVPYELEQPAADRRESRIVPMYLEGDTRSSRQTGPLTAFKYRSGGMVLSKDFANEALCYYGGMSLEKKGRENDGQSESAQNLTDDAILIKVNVDVHFETTGPRRGMTSTTTVVVMQTRHLYTYIHT